MNAVLLYDGDCGLCTRSVLWLQRHAMSAATVEAWQQADLAPLGLSDVDRAEAVQWADNGRRAVGPDAIAAYLQTGTHSWRTAGRVLASPTSRRLSWPVYRWFAGHRDQLPGGRPARRPPRTTPSVRGIRRRRSGDLAACVRLLRVVFSEGRCPVGRPEAPRDWLDGDEVLDAWVLEREGEILGHVAIAKVGLDSLSALRWREVTGHEPSELAGVSRFFVRPRVRGQGMGTALLEVAVAEIRARGLVPVLDVVSADKDATRLYEDTGWRLRAMYPWGKRADGRHLHYYEHFGRQPEQNGG